MFCESFETYKIFQDLDLKLVYFSKKSTFLSLKMRYPRNIYRLNVNYRQYHSFISNFVVQF